MNNQSETTQAVQEIIDNEERLKERVIKAENTLSNFRRSAIEIAAHLAFAGNMPHKAKNEAILHAIARLLAFSTNYRPDMDDIPF